MNMKPMGKGIFIWKGSNVLKGDLQATIQACLRMGLSWVALKIGDDTDAQWASYPGKMAGVVRMFQAAGLKVWGWHYIYGGVYVSKSDQFYVEGPLPADEADFARQQVQALNLDGYIIDAEKEWKGMNQKLRAKTFMDRLRGIGVPVALCSYRFPSLHPQFPWAEFLAGCDLHMPQVYWGPGRAVSDLEKSLFELLQLRSLPIVPVGRAYIGDGHADPKPEELTALMKRAFDRGMPGFSFWALDFLYMHAGGAARMAAIEAYQWGESTPVTVVHPVVVGHVTVMAKTLNVRAGPNVGTKDLGDLAGGSCWFYFERDGDWVMIGDGCWIKLGEGLARDDKQD